MKPLGEYINGNYTVRIYSDGTKVRFNDLDNLTPEFPESIDLKITNMCDMGCPACHEASTMYGNHADIMNLPFIDTMHPYTEIAIGGGNPLEHPDLEAFLVKLKEKNLIASMTVNGKHFIREIDRLRSYKERGLIHGLGVSYHPNLTMTEYVKFCEYMASFSDAVLHVIAGMISPGEFRNLSERCKRILVLGFKKLRRGDIYFQNNASSVISGIFRLRLAVAELIEQNNGCTLCFDNLALEQLGIKSLVGEDRWKKLYMGGDGQYTMFVDAVTGEYSASSTNANRYPITENLTEMFTKIRR